MPSKYCTQEGCNKRPHYCSPYDTSVMYCAEHKFVGMVDKYNICKAINCTRSASFNSPGVTKRLYCSEHKLDGMMNVCKKKHCKHEGCSISPSYNFFGNKIKLYCAKHKLEGMVFCSQFCIEKECTKKASFNYPNQKQYLYCSNHKLEGMKNIKANTCKSCYLFIAHKRNNYLCSYCNPNKPKYQKTKEMQVRQLLEKHNIPFTHNQQVSNDCCLRYRPDFVVDCSTHFLVLEVDEHAHSGYEKDCEIVRMNNISHSLGLPTKFIRYNPDNKVYTTKHKESVLIESLQKHMTQLDNIEPLYLFY